MNNKNVKAKRRYKKEVNRGKKSMTKYQSEADGCLVGFYGISTFIDYIMPNPFLYK